MIRIATHVIILLFVDIPEAWEKFCVPTEWHFRASWRACEGDTATLIFSFNPPLLSISKSNHPCGSAWRPWKRRWRAVTRAGGVS